LTAAVYPFEKHLYRFKDKALNRFRVKGDAIILNVPCYFPAKRPP
jgi:hypothetical protein